MMWKIENWIVPACFLVGSMLAGLLIKRIVIRRLKMAADGARWEFNRVIIESLRNLPMIWLALAGLYGAILTSPLSVAYMRALENVLIVILILTIILFLSRLSTGSIEIYSRKQAGILASASILKNLARIFILLLGLLTIFHAFGINITPALTALGVGGLAVALALQDTLANFFSGLQLIASRQISPGDYVKLHSGEEGYVTDITWRQTTIRTLPNNRLVIPNSHLASNLFTNFYLPSREMSVLVEVGVSYDSDLEQVEKVTIDVAKETLRETAGAVADFETFIRYHTFDQSSINFSVILRGKEYTDQYMLKHQFIKRLHSRFRAEGIVIPFPIRTVYMRQEE